MFGKYRIYYIIAFIVASCSILYELLMAQTLTVLAGNAVARYSLTIGLFLVSMGIGAFLCRKKIAERAFHSLIVVEFGLSFFGAVCVAAAHASHVLANYYYLQGHPGWGAVLFFGISHAFIIVIGILTGLELPLLIRLQKKINSEKRTTSRVLAMDYFGSLTGAVLFPLLLLPQLGIFQIGFMVALLNALVAVFLLIAGLKRFRGAGAALIFANAFLIIIIIFCFIRHGAIEQYFLKKYYFYYETAEDAAGLFGPMDDYPDVERHRSPYQNIDIVYYPTEGDMDALLFPHYSEKEDMEHEFPEFYFLFLNGDYQFYSNVEELYHEYFVHVPIIANRVPEKVLVLGGGDGLVDRELLKYDGVESITHVDLDEKMIGLGRDHEVLKKLNRGSFDDPRVNVVIGDGYQYVRDTDEKFDAIFIDFPTPVDYNLAKLYSREFYAFVRRALKEDGFAALDAPGSLILDEPNDWARYNNSVRAGGFENVVPYVSVLENDNQAALEEIMQMELVGYQEAYPGVEGNEYVLEDEDEKKEAAQQLLDEFVYMNMQGFIFMNKDSDPVELEWRDDGVKFKILNEKRFGLAFSIPYSSTKYIDKSEVNSILRPTFPSLPFWYTRMPY